ncbi:hypothetical protein [Roseibacillus ishigakijimensis]|uniref:Zinc-regulated TonB-dependent outer membrane receptor n=1 Tax=Roseibacillus ishigakijimensis TaxID=454146 RepID=A0A934RUG5_9BACT|nr:hypothetical protein [Roseibacillus ishigakijimensis]MBK1835224.1 hypothetical protein [Roseibacillus ishigakijimensis]
MIFRTATALSMVVMGSAQADWELYDREDWLSFAAHLRVVGAAGGGDFEELAAHAHDPNRDLSLQGIEFATSMRLNDHVHGFTTFNVFRSLDDDLDVDWEEGFLKFADLPGGFEVRGGRYLNRFGGQNSTHLHGWDFVDANLVTAAFLGDHGLATEGAEVSWIWEGPVTSAFSFSFGNALGHSHGHDEHEEHEHEEEEHEEAEHEEEEHHHEHGHGAGEEAFFDDNLFTGRWLVRWDYNDFHRHEFGLNGGWGENGYGRDTQLYSGDYYYTYRENGLEPGGRFLRLGAELYFRDVEWAHEEDGHAERGDADHWGVVASATYGFAENWEAGLRYDYIEGVESGPEPEETIFAVEERHRYSAALTRRFQLAEDFSALARLQVNFDDLPDEDEQSVYLQLGFDWGGPEVR